MRLLAIDHVQLAMPAGREDEGGVKVHLGVADQPLAGSARRTVDDPFGDRIELMQTAQGA